MRACPFCAEQVQDAAIKCKHCGSNLADPASPPSLVNTLDVANLTDERRTTVAAILGIAAGGILALGPFLPFVRAGILSASGLEKTGNEAFTIVSSGIILAILGVFGILLRKRFAFWNVLNGAAAAGLTFYYQAAIEQQLATVQGISVSLGAGLHLCYFGSILAVVAGLICVQTTRRKSKIVRLPRQVTGTAAHWRAS